jgi:hypothetical protein
MATAQNSAHTDSKRWLHRFKATLPYLIVLLPSIEHFMKDGAALDAALFATASFFLTYLLLWAVRKEWGN